MQHHTTNNLHFLLLCNSTDCVQSSQSVAASQYRCARAPENRSFQPRAGVAWVAMAQLSCSFSIYCGSKCDFSSRWPGRQQLMPLSSCEDSVREHLREAKVSQTCVASEKELILARVGLFGDSDGRDFTICPKHRVELGVRFRFSVNWNASILFTEIGGARLREE